MPVKFIYKKLPIVNITIWKAKLPSYDNTFFAYAFKFSSICEFLLGISTEKLILVIPIFVLFCQTLFIRLSELNGHLFDSVTKVDIVHFLYRCPPLVRVLVTLLISVVKSYFFLTARIVHVQFYRPSILRVFFEHHHFVESRGFIFNFPFRGLFFIILLILPFVENFLMFVQICEKFDR